MTAAAGPDPQERRSWVEQVMGMPVSVHLRGPGSRSSGARSRVQAVHDGLRAVDALFSTYRPDSQVSLIDRGGSRSTMRTRWSTTWSPCARRRGQ